MRCFSADPGPLQRLGLICSSIPDAFAVVFAVTSVHLAGPCLSCQNPPGCHEGLCICSRGTADALIEGLLNCCDFNEAEGFHLALGTVLCAHEQGLQLFSRNGRWYYKSVKLPQMICPCSHDSLFHFYLIIKRKWEGFCLLLQSSLCCVACLYPWPLSFCFKVQQKSKGEVYQELLHKTQISHLFLPVGSLLPASYL